MDTVMYSDDYAPSDGIAGRECITHFGTEDLEPDDGGDDGR
jgi:hypothetical protein